MLTDLPNAVNKMLDKISFHKHLKSTTICKPYFCWHYALCFVESLAQLSSFRLCGDCKFCN